ncbi:right-handed parallel beta-helix repeat-containing protein [Marimonas arenosa]|uniref:Right-handed parallel beta-helix repeat-containing protein n=2 Tax=Marimonas arenosa TaxID=1795305 RepID=A0AAE3WBJ7_9RHOB|nr:right-handed parallel beta-helix repeat-containing protein [Marimonas arenosa]
MLWSILAGNSFAQTTHYVAPPGEATASTADGSETKPWATIADALKNAIGGDTILLMDGDFGMLKIYGVVFDTPVVIRSLNAKNAHLESIYVLGGSRNLTFQNLSVWPNTPNTKIGKLVESLADTSHITIQGLDIRGGGKLSQEYLNWTANEWSSKNEGVFLTGPYSTVRDNTLIGVTFGVTTVGEGAVVTGNIIEGFSGDGLRGLGNQSVFRGNRVINSITIDDNHDDGFQSWATSGSVDGLVIENNTFIEWNASETHPLRGAMQGIGLFDGFYDNLIIRNNVVSVTYYHGISVYGGRNATIVNNTLVSSGRIDNMVSWIGVFDHRNGQRAQNVLVANNVAPNFVLGSNDMDNVVLTDNVYISDPFSQFENAGNYDFRPTVDSGFVDKGNPDHAPAFDILGNARPAGAGPDVGAYELGGTATGGNGTSTDSGTATGGGSTTDGTTTSTDSGTTTDGNSGRRGNSWGPKWETPPGKDKKNK